MRLGRFALILLAALSFAPHSAAAKVASIGWDDLLPAAYGLLETEAEGQQARLDALPEGSQDAFRMLSDQNALKRQLASGELRREFLSAEDIALLETDYRTTFPEAAAIADRVDRMAGEVAILDKQTNPELDGKMIRMPGYVLPLEFDGAKVTEFLLVPFVGACIHTPPPPPNQMAHAHYAPGFESQGLFTPVYITGRLSAVDATVNLSLVDGQSPVATGYRLDVTVIEPYKE